MKLRKGDKVLVIAGKDKGREGTIERVYVKQNKVMIPEINVYKRHIKKSDQYPDGGVIPISRPIDISKVMFVNPTTKKPARLGYVIEAGKKFRIDRKTKEKVDKK